jgi:hypothetical protein
MVNCFRETFLLALFLFCMVFASAQSGYEIHYRQAGGQGNALANAGNGNFAYCGSLDSLNNGEFKTLVMLQDSSGNILWKSRLETNQLLNYPSSMEVIGNNLFVGGRMGINTQNGEAYLLKYDLATGNLLASRGCFPEMMFGFNDIKASTGGRFYTTGHKAAFLSNSTIVSRWDSGLNLIWSRRIESASATFIAEGGTATLDGGFVAYGSTSQGGNNAFLTKLDSLGNIQWTKIYGTLDDDHLAGVIETPSGFTAIGHSVVDAGPDDYSEMQFLRLDSSGNLLQARRYSDTLSLSPADVEPFGGSYLVAGQAYSIFFPIGGAFVLKVDSLGEIDFATILLNDYDHYQDLEVLPCGGMQAIGRTQNPGPGPETMVISRLNASGSSGCNSRANVVDTIAGAMAPFAVPLVTSTPDDTIFVRAWTAVPTTFSMDTTCFSACSQQTMVVLNDTAFCPGDTLRAQETGGGGCAISWLIGGNVVGNGPAFELPISTVGSYSLSVATLSDWCADTSSYAYEVFALPVAAFTYNPLGFAFDFLDNSSGTSSWFWDFGDGNTSALQNPQHTYLTTGNFVVCLTASNLGGCENTWCDTIYAALAVEDPQFSRIKIYPNPVAEVLNLDIPPALGPLQIEIFDAQGRKVSHGQLERLSGGFLRIGMQDLPGGLYLLRMSGKQAEKSFRIMKQ